MEWQTNIPAGKTKQPSVFMVVLFSQFESKDVMVIALDEEDACKAALSYNPGYHLLTALEVSSIVN